MPLPIFSRFAAFAVLAAAFLAPAALSAQLERQLTIPAGKFVKETRFTQAVFTNVPGGLQIQALDRKDLFVVAALDMLPPGKSFEVTRVVVRFRNPKNSGALLGSVRLSSEYGSKLLDVSTSAGNDRSIAEVYTPAQSANAWRIRATIPPTTVNSKTIVRLGIDSQLPIDPDGPGPPPPNYQPKGEPFVLLSVDVYVTIPIGTTSTTKASTTGARVTPAPAPSPAPAPPAPAKPIADLPGSKGVIYIINDSNQLLWYRHDGRERGAFEWAAEKGSQVGTGWDFRTVLGAGNGVMYGVTREGDLIWYRHTGAGNGSFNWAQSNGQKVNSGFTGIQVIAAGGGVLYGLKRNGDLLWYRHDGFGDGTDRWTAREGRIVASNFPMSQIFAGDGGTLYAIRHGEVFRYRHDGRADGTAVWANPAGQKIASNWNDYLFAFSSGDGIIYALNSQRQLLWFRDQGCTDDTVRWENGGMGEVVGTGWQFRNIFSGAALRP